MRNINFINPENFINAINQCDKGRFGNIDSADFEIIAEDIRPLEGYKKRVDFPNCCEWHTSVHENALKWFERFPDCCDRHRKLIGKSWFDKDNYKRVVDKIMNQLAFTEHCISKNIEKDNWHKPITDYIDWNISSFGQLPSGFGSPVGIDEYIHSLIQRISSFDNKERASKLIEHIESIVYKNESNPATTDLNVLKETYDKWFKIFPFEISFFAHLKDYFKKTLPIINGKTEVNQYTRIGKVKVHTKDSLISILLSLTNHILTEINAHTLYQEGLLTQPQKIKLELIVNERKMKLQQGYINHSKSEEQRYRKILKEWFVDEKRFIDEITPLLENMTLQQSSKTKIPEKYYALYHWLLIEIGKEKVFERNANDLYNKTEIIQFAKNRYKINGQGFYSEFKSLDITNKISIAKSYGKGYKEKLIHISDNNAEVISVLKKYPN